MKMAKTTNVYRRKNCFKAHHKLFLGLVICFLIPVSLTSAFEFDNIKNFDKDVGDYGKYTIRNSVLRIPFLQLDKVIELELKENSEVCEGFECYAKKEITMYEDGALIDDIRFFYMNQDGSEYFDSLDYNLNIITGKKIIVIVDDYETRCINGKYIEPFLDINGTLIKGYYEQICNRIKTGSHEEEKDELIKYNLGEEVEAGTYQIKLEGQLPNMFTSIDWQIKSNGYWLDEWALWSSGLNNKLLMFLNMTKSGVEILDTTGNGYNGTIHGTLTERSGHLNEEQYGNSWNYSNFISINKTGLQGMNNSFSFMAWVNVTSTGGLSPIISFGGTNSMDLNIQAGGLFQVSKQGVTTYLIGTTDLRDSLYHQIILVVEANGTGRLYIDGVSEVNQSAGTSYTGTQVTTLGESQGGADTTWIGTIDEIGLWNRTLTNTEIIQLYNLGVGITHRADIDITVTLDDPLDANITLNTLIRFKVNSTSSANNLLNTTLYVWNASNQALTNFTTITGTTNITNLTLNLDAGSYTWNQHSCSDEVACEWSGFNLSLTVARFTEDSITFNANTKEGLIEKFELNVTLGDSSFNSVNFVYNGTNNTATIISDGSKRSITSSINIPTVPSEKNVSFYWELNFNTGLENSSINNQTIRELGIDDCSSFSEIVLNLTLIQEEEQFELNGTTNNTKIKIDLGLFRKGSISESAIISINKSFEKINPVAICLEAINDSEYEMDTIISYESIGRFREFYHIQNFSLTNQTMNQNISLFNLNSSVGQEFKITYKNSNFNIVPGALIQVQRQYIGEGVFKTVEIPKISSAGYTIAHLIRSNIAYNLIVIREGVVLDSFNNIVANCQTPTLDECKINLNSLASSVSPADFDSVGDFSSTLTFNEDTRVVSSTFVITSGVSADTSLNVTLFDAFGNKSVCDDKLFSAGGTLSCTIPESFGNTTTIIKIYSNGDVKKEAILKIDAEPSDIYGANLIFIGLLMMLLIIGLAITENPLILGVMLVFGMISLIGLNIVSSAGWIGAGATILWLVLAVIMILIKGSNRQ